MKSKHLITFTLINLILFSANCSLVKEVREEFKKAQTFNSRDNKTQMAAPGTWIDIEDEDTDITLRVEHMIDEVFVYVLSTPREDQEEIDLVEYTNEYISDLKRFFKNPKTSKPQSLKINNLPAAQFSITGYYEEEKEEIKQIYTIIVSENNIHIVATYSHVDKFDEYRPIFLNIVKSFKEL